MPEHHTTAPRRRLRRTAVMTLAAGTMLSLPTTADAAPARVAPSSAVEVLRLHCNPTTTHPGDMLSDSSPTYGVTCRWTVPTDENAVGVRLLRIAVGTDTSRQQIFATRDLTENTHADTPVRPDRRYAYRVQAVNRNGRVVSSSRTVTVGVPSVSVEPLRLDCTAADTDAATRTRIGCRWSLPTESGARTLTLWRSVDNEARERVTSSHHPFVSSYRDVVPAGTSRVVYAVIATDGDGTIVARSRPDVVKIPNRPHIARAERLQRTGTVD